MTARNAETHTDETPASRIEVAKARVSDALETTRDSVGHAVDVARDRSSAAYEAARARAADARGQAAKGIEENPIVALLGGLAVGVIAAAVLPRSERETRALAPLGSKLNDAARDALEAARDAGKAKLGELGINTDSGRDALRSLIDSAVATLGSAGSAAVDAARKGGTR